MHRHHIVKMRIPPVQLGDEISSSKSLVQPKPIHRKISIAHNSNDDETIKSRMGCHDSSPRRKCNPGNSWSEFAIAAKFEVECAARRLRTGDAEGISCEEGSTTQDT
jgi:hypothetical protein